MTETPVERTPVIGDRIQVLIDLSDGIGRHLEPCRVIGFSCGGVRPPNDFASGDVMTIELKNHNGRVKSERLHVDTTTKKMQLVWLTKAAHSIWMDGRWVELAQKR